MTDTTEDAQHPAGELDPRVIIEQTFRDAMDRMEQRFTDMATSAHQSHRMLRVVAITAVLVAIGLLVPEIRVLCAALAATTLILTLLWPHRPMRYRSHRRSAS